MIISWIAISKIQTDAYLNLESNEFITLKQNPGFLKPLGITGERAFRPWLVVPSIQVWQEIVRRINNDLIGKARGRSSVLNIREQGDLIEKVVSFSVRFFRPNIISVEVKIKTDFELSLQDMFSIRNITSHPCLLAAVDSLVGIIKSGKVNNYQRNNSFSSKPAMIIPVDGGSKAFLDWKAKNKDILASLLINNLSFSHADEQLSETLFARNKDINVKTGQSAIALISKQGVLSMYANQEKNLIGPFKKEHFKRIRFLEYALVLREFISEFQKVRQHDEDVADFLLFLIQPLIKDGANIPKSVTGTHVWEVLSEELRFNDIIEKLDKHVLERVEEKTEYFLAFDQMAYDSLEFSERLKIAMKGFRKSRFEIYYKQHPGAKWLVGVVLSFIVIIIGVVKWLLGK